MIGISCAEMKERERKIIRNKKRRKVPEIKWKHLFFCECNS